MMEIGYAPPARFSHDRKYRYLLTRQLRPLYNGVVTFVMLNPSTADETQDDSTIRRCIGFADRWTYKWLFVVNLSPLRATNPKDLLAAGSEPDRVWDTNMACIQEAATKSDLVVAAWGAHGGAAGRDAAVAAQLRDSVGQIHSLGTTKDGHPKHPLYLRANSWPVPFTRPYRHGGNAS